MFCICLKGIIKFFNLSCIFYSYLYLSIQNIFRSARTSCTTFGWFVPPVPPVRPVRPALKICITYIQAYMPYES